MGSNPTSTATDLQPKHRGWSRRRVGSQVAPRWLSASCPADPDDEVPVSRASNELGPVTGLVNNAGTLGEKAPIDEQEAGPAASFVTGSDIAVTGGL